MAYSAVNVDMYMYVFESHGVFGIETQHLLANMKQALPWS